MEFKDKYLKLLTEKKQNPESLSGESIKLLGDLNAPDKWFEAMAVCEAAADAGKMDENILKLRHKMFLQGRELHAGINLDGQDYADWFAQLVDFNKKLAEAGIAEAWVELSSIYDNARFPYSDCAKAEEYMLKGVNLDNPLALALYGYHLYCGADYVKVDREKGMELMLKSKEKNFARADSYLLLAESDSLADDEVEAYIRKVVEHNSVSEPVNQLWGILGDLYYSRLNNLAKAVEFYDRGIESGDPPYCKYKKATLILNGEIEGDKDEALLMIKDAYEWDILNAADFLGQFYTYNQEYRNLDTAIEWYEKAVSYSKTSSMINLAFVYLYEDESKRDVEKGLKYLDMAIENKNVRALSEKAYFLLETGEENKNIPLAKELLDEANEKGDGYAAYRLGYGYQNAEFSEERDFPTAFKYYTVGAERGHLYAIEMLGQYYRSGIAVEADNEKAVEYYSRAVEKGSNYARVELALCYEEGAGVEQDDSRAFELLKLAAGDNYIYAHNRLGYYYLNGIACETDLDRAFEHFTQAAEGGNLDAMYNLGRMYKYSVGRPENPETALKYFAEAAEKGDLNANLEMGLSYELEYGGLEFDGQKAMEYMAYAADRDHPYAQYKMGVYHYYGMVEENMEKGLEYLQKAYANGSVYAAATLGDHFLYGRDETADSGEAFAYYKYAADRDYITEGVGLCYLYGIGVESSDSEAFKYFLIAADRDVLAAKFRLGLCYKYERGTVKNLAEAYRWLSEAAGEESRGAEYELGMMLLKGEGVAMDTEKGVEWLRKAADNEYAEAQLELGNCYLTGQGVEEDDVQAMYWYQKAAENGNEDAQKIIGKRSRKRR
ncbi:MAG: sel1 repeat family protein [Prevotellaceae bacterium]|jgi:TPR repeat protein|nr:sel1 repeat family protein [Prevotellaceae bacterium]